MKTILLFGPPASGKGTMSEKLIKDLGYKHFSTGDIIREEIKKETPIGKKAVKIMKGGNLLTDEIVIEMVKSQIKKNKNKKGILFDGFPRTIKQAEFITKELSNIDIVFYLKIKKDIALKRIMSRGLRVGEDKATFKKDSNNRFSVYNNETKPVLKYLKSQKLQVVEIDASQNITKEYSEIKKHIKKI